MENGNYLKLICFGESERKVKNGDMLFIDIKKFDRNGTVIKNEAAGRIKFKMSLHGPFLPEILNLAQGDSVSIIHTEEGKLKDRTEVRIIKLQTEEEYNAEQKRIAEIGDMEENKILKKYIAENSITVKPIFNGLYIIPLRQGHGDNVKAGKTVAVTYTGCFLDGRQFDATGKGQPLEFVYGTEMQVIEGLRIAIGRMKEGAKSKIIIPSHFAYGEAGSSTGIVPPFTSLVYEVEVVSVK